MSSLVSKPLAKKVDFDEDNMVVELMDGRTIIVPIVHFPRLLKASSKERKNHIISGGGTGIHWEEVDEDIRVDNLLFGVFEAEGPLSESA